MVSVTEKRVEPPISNVSKKKKNGMLTDSLEQPSRIMTTSQVTNGHTGAREPPQRIYF